VLVMKLDMGVRGFAGVMLGALVMGVSEMSVMGARLVIAIGHMRRCLTMMLGSVFVMFGGVLVMLGGMFGVSHDRLPLLCRILRLGFNSAILRQIRDEGRDTHLQTSYLSRRTGPMRHRADVILVELGHFPSRARAQAAIEAGLVSVDGTPLRKASAEIDPSARIEAREAHPWVSRGGVKLQAALDSFHLDPSGLDCLDVGASTGGFTDVLLSRGARRVYAIDVGRGQLDARLRENKQVSVHEGLDARKLTGDLFEAPPAAVVCDVSFISLRLVLPHVLPIAAARAWLVALIKPQFEAGREYLVKGAVKDPAVHSQVCEAVRLCAKALGWSSLGIIPSPIPGGDGAKEFLFGARRD
jgi:23S rRNA (cytidine1920-2'-O)/16S rRNA (cytidine1409-2'-O)-methyltransferase